MRFTNELCILLQGPTLWSEEKLSRFCMPFSQITCRHKICSLSVFRNFIVMNYHTVFGTDAPFIYVSVSYIKAKTISDPWLHMSSQCGVVITQSTFSKILTIENTREAELCGVCCYSIVCFILCCFYRSAECNTVKPVYNDHLMGNFSALWSSSRWAPEGRNC